MRSLGAVPRALGSDLNQGSFTRHPDREPLSLALGIALAALPNVFRLSRRPARGLFSLAKRIGQPAPTAPSSSCRPAEPRQPHSISSMALYATSTVGNTVGNDRFIPTAHNDDQNAPPPPAGDARAALLRQALLGARGRVLQFAKQTPMPAAMPRAQRSPRTAPRRACATPFRVLAAPGLRDDFYLDLVCWSRLDIIAVGLGSRVRLYRASNLKELCDVGIGDAVASLAWSPDGRRLAVGCASGKIALYDVGRGVVVTPANGHRGRVGCLDWRGDVLASGSRDRGVACRDVRVSVSKRAVAAMASWPTRRSLRTGARVAAQDGGSVEGSQARGLRPALVAGRRRAGDGRQRQRRARLVRVEARRRRPGAPGPRRRGESAGLVAASPRPPRDG